MDCVNDGRSHNIISFLERPLMMVTAAWQTNVERGTVLQAFELPWDLLFKDMYKTKVDRFYGFRADCEIRVQVNSQPFQAGRLLLSWIPGYRYLGSKQDYYKSTVTSLNANIKFLPPITGCPHIDLDLSTCTEATMCVPYISPYSFSELPNGIGSMGRFQLVVYSPLVDSSAGTVDYTIFMNFKNIQLRYPTGLPLTATAQIGSEAVEEAGGAGIITSTASAISTALGAVADIPGVSQFAQPALWVSKNIADVARQFGWSKPTSIEAPHVTKLSSTRFMANSDGVDTSHVLSLLSDNSLETDASLFRTNVDEMALSHVARTQTFYTRFAWNATSPAGSVLFSAPITPNFYRYTISTAQYAPTTLAYTSAAFRQWRGGINFNFKFVKTKFHSGRVRLIYVPGDYSNGVTLPSNFDIDANYSTVVDLRSDTDVEFNVPFVAIQQWLLVDNAFPGTARDNTFSTGTIYMVVLNELRAVSTVSSSIDVITEVGAAADFELSIPRLPSIYPSSVLFPPPAAADSVLNRLVRATAQVGEAEAVIAPPEVIQATGAVTAPLTSKDFPATNYVGGAITVGEKVSSIRQVLKRFHRVFTDQNAGNLITGAYQVQPSKVNSPLLNGSTLPRSIDMYDYYSYLYAFFRGSFRFKVLPYDAQIYAARVRLLPEQLLTAGSEPVAFATGLLPESYTAADVYMPRNLEGVFEFQVPHYARYPILPITAGGNMSSDLFQRNFTEIDLSTSNTNVLLDRTKITVYRAVGDDFSFNQLIGPPFVSQYTAT
nr:putative capsid protein [Hubei picorna-like virus]